MKIKELKRTVNVCWSPAETHPTYLAAGSAAQQVDASFSSNSTLDIYSLNLEDPGLDLELKSSLQTQHKFQKLVWSGSGVVVGGCDGGLLEFYSADKLLNSSPDALLGSNSKHTGNVSALDINPYQKNLLASGASDSEIFIWDLNNTAQPMAPGNRSQPLDHVQALAWNQQVQHILGSTFSNRCVVWDLRKNEPIMKLSDSVSRTRWRALAWQPAVATQLCVASEDDQAPVIQLWDLRLAASPLVTLEGHHKGVSALSWCRQEPELMASAARDGRVLCWNPNDTRPGGELLLELCQQQQWVYDVSWCPRDPGLLVSSSFDQQLTVHSLLGGSPPETTRLTACSIMESFGGEASFSQLPAVSRAPPPAAPRAAPLPPRAPRWLRRPVRARFAFGGKLVTFEKCPQEAGPQKLVYISQVVSEPEIVERATELDAVLGSSLSQDPNAMERLAEYCRLKAEACAEQQERYTWLFLRANFLPAARTELLNLLGFKQDDVPSKFKGTQTSGDPPQPDAILSRGESTETEAELSTDTSTDLSDAHTLIERRLANVDLGSSVTNVDIPNGEDSSSMICRALVCGNLEEAVELCLEAKRMTDALIIASIGSPELVLKVQQLYVCGAAGDAVPLLAGCVLLSRWDTLLRRAAPAAWRHALAALLAHAADDQLPRYCEMLGDKLSAERDPALSSAAVLCYLCGVSGDALGAAWGRAARGAAQGGERGGAQALAALAEMALLARRAAAARGCQEQSAGRLEAVLRQFAWRLAAQGCLHSALAVLRGAAPCELAQRLRSALGADGPAATAQQPTQQYGSRTRTVSGQSQKRGHLVTQNDVSNTYNAVPAQYGQQQSWGNSSVSAPAYNPPVPRPGSTGPQSGGITSRSKYKVDPSVQSAPLYNQYSFNNTSYNNPQYNSPLPDQYAGGVQAGFTPVNPAAPPAAPAPPANGAYPPPEPAVAAVPCKPVPPGWNDPPMVGSIKPKPKQDLPAQAPITHPLFGVEPPQHVPLNPTQQYPGQYQQQYPGQQQQYPGQQQQYQGQHQQYPGQQQQYPGQQQQHPDQQFPQYNQQYAQQFPGVAPVYPQQAESPMPAEPPAPVQKAALPEQHAALQAVFDALRADCAARAANPQMKRKLEDVQKRLETLYDMLREYRLSEAALGSLHTCAQYAQGGEYENALQVATSLATGTDFAAAASFLPGLKVLFQLAQQLQVYER